MTSTLPPSTPTFSRWWRTSLLLALFVLGFDLLLHWLLRLDHIVFGVIHALSSPLIVLLAAGWSWYTSRQLTPEQGQMGWRWIAGGITLIWPALTAWNVALLSGNASPLLPSLLLLFLPISTLLVIIGLFKLPSGVGTPTETLRLFFDLAIVLLLSGLIMFYFVIVPALDQGSPRGVRLATTFVPMASLLQFFLLWMLLGLQQQQPQRYVTRWLMLGGLFLILSSALFFPAVGREVQQEHLYSLFIQLYYLIFIPAAYEQLRVVPLPSVPRTPKDQVSSRRWLPVVGLLLVLILIWEQVTLEVMLEPANLPLSLGFTGLVMLVAVREFLRMRESEQIHQQLLALNQSLEQEIARQTASLREANLELISHRDNLSELVRERTRELEEKSEKLVEANKLKSQFLANTSHELRTPLSAIMGYIDMMLMGVTGPPTTQQGEILQRMQRNAQRLLNQINELLDLSTIQAQRLRFHPQPVHVLLLLQESSREARLEAERRQMVFQVEAEEGLPKMIQSDPERLRQLIEHLLSNALKFTREGHIILRAGGDEAQWFFEVEDTGIGIAPHLHAIIFDEFRQADGSRTREIGGVGLGLAIVRRLSEMMGGAVSVSSVVGEGSTFRVTLPLALPDELLQPVTYTEEVLL